MLGRVLRGWARLVLALEHYGRASEEALGKLGLKSEVAFETYDYGEV